MKLTANQVLSPVSPQQADKGGWTQFLRIMKLTTIIILAACLHVSAKGIAQQTITFSGKEVNLENVFNAIKKQTNYRFFFNTDMLKNASKVTIEVKNAQIEQVMNLALKDQPLTFAIKGRTIFIMKKTEEEKKSVQVASPTGDPITVSGRVTDDQGQPLVGANVKVKGSQNGITTDAQGRFTLTNVDPNATLEVSFVGHETQILAVKGKTIFSVALGQRQSILDETVVIAYGTTSRRFATGNVASVKASDIEKQPVNNPLLALQGRVPGLFIEQSSGLSGTGITVRIQGINSFRGNDPLYVIDGVPYSSQTLPTLNNILGNSGPNYAGSTSGAGNPLSYINPADIESIDVLKDADATSIFGSRAANGAILITTKRGKAGDTRVNVNIQHGWGKVTRMLDLMNTEQYLEMRREAYINDGMIVPTISTIPDESNYDLTVWDQNENSDWQKELIGGTSKYTDAQLNVSGGNSNVQYLLGAGFHRETTVFPGDFDNKRSSIHLSLNSTSANKKFRLQFNGNFTFNNNKLPGVDLTANAIQLAPNAPSLFDMNGNLNWGAIAMGGDSISTWLNPLSYLYNTYRNRSENLIGNAVMGYQIFPGFEIKSSFGYTNLRTDEMNLSPLIAKAPELRSGLERTSNFANSSIKSWIIEPQLVYNTNFDHGKLEVLIGATFQQSESEREQITASGFVSDLVLEDIKQAPRVTAGSGISSQYKYNAIFSRLNYNYHNKYIFNLSGRRDGSSRFGSKNLFNNFWSVSTGWIFSNESYFQKKVKLLSYGKLRISYGTTGNDQIGDYQFYSLFTSIQSSTSVPYQGEIGRRPDGLSNSRIQWEETGKLQAGLDVGIFNNKILLNLNYIYNRSSNQLTSYALPIQTGFSNVIKNFPAVIQNTAWEFSINTSNLKTTRFNWSSSFNLTIPRNKLVKYPELEKSSQSNTLVIGEPVNVVKVYHYLGVNTDNGLYQFADKNGEITLEPDFSNDRLVVVDPNPRFYGGFQNNLRFKEFELDFLFQFVRQNGQNYFGGDRPGYFSGSPSFGNLGNQPLDVINRWQKNGDRADFQKYTTSSFDNGYFNLLSSDAVWSDASYIRLKNVSISWKFPFKLKNNFRYQSCRLYLQGQNLITFTNYPGLDPENRSTLFLPPLRVITLGFQLSL